MGPLRNGGTSYLRCGEGWHIHHGSLPQSSPESTSATPPMLQQVKAGIGGHKELPAVGEIQI